MVSFMYSMMNMTSTRERNRLVEIPRASHPAIAKPAMIEAQKGTEIKGRYPSWYAEKRVTTMSKASKRRFRDLTVLASCVIASLLPTGTPTTPSSSSEMGVSLLSLWNPQIEVASAEKHARIKKV
jgi:hypothetical protein